MTLCGVDVERISMLPLSPGSVSRGDKGSENHCSGILLVKDCPITSRNDIHFHHRMDFPHRVTFRRTSSVAMIGWRVPNVIKRFTCNGDDVLLGNFERVSSLDAEWKLLRCPAEYCLPNLTPLWADRNLGANRSNVVPGCIYQREVNVAVCFYFCVNDPPSESIPLFL
jgi:hypothetical protein